MKIYDEHKKNTSLHLGRIEYVHESGMMDVRSKTNGAFFSKIGVLQSGIESSYAPGENCIVLTDGAFHIVIGKVNEPKRNSSGKTTVKNIANEFHDVENINSIVCNDGIGNKMSVSVSSSFGVLLDGGGVCTVHLDPYHDKIFSVSERLETITTPMSINLDHDGTECVAKIKFRSAPDSENINKEFEYISTETSNLGFSFVIDADKNGILLTNYNNGDVKSTISISADGDILIESNSSIQLNTEGDININSGSASMTLKSDGKVRIENSAVELLSLLDQLMDQIASSKTLTFYGPQPLLPSSVSIPLIRQQLALIKDS